MYHLLGWTEDVVTATLTDLNPIPDEITTIENNHFLPSSDVRGFFAVGYGTDLQRLRLTTPKLRQVSPLFIRPIEPALVGVDDINMAIYDRAPLSFRGQEEMVLEAIHDAGVNQRITALMAIGQNLVAVPPGDCYVIRATSTTAATANVWSLLTYTLDQQLPAGRYAVVLAEYIGANGQAIRLIFDDQYNRPGMPAIVDVNQRLPYPFYEYPFGVWGYFKTFSLPRMQVLCNGATAAHEIYLHVIPVPG